MPQNRTRNYERLVGGGKVFTSTGDLVSEPYYVFERKTTRDYIRKKKLIKPDALSGFLPATPLRIDHVEAFPLEFGKNFGFFHFESLADQTWTMIPDVRSPYLSDANLDARVLQNQELTSELLAATNPFRSEFSIPVFAKELLELPLLFKNSAQTFAGYVGGAHLQYKFGYTQFKRDITDLAKITKAIEVKVRELESLSKKGGLRRRLTMRIYADDVVTDDVVIHSTFGAVVKARRHNRMTHVIRGSVRWTPTTEFAKELKTLNKWNLAVAKVFDNDFESMDPTTLWNSIPFTWLIDYFGNIGDVLLSLRGRIHYTPEMICIMRGVKSTDSYQVTYGDEVSTVNGLGVVTRVLKERDGPLPTPIQPIVRSDLLNANQWTTILALFLKFRG